uniref:non-specific serine/threonine protein kinase n=1 Tax=Eutreptiella gymnastica TaxID=73025 RepID=A0A7S1NMW2_9EUGL|mmetsp:Transcript_6335/g.11259  ORF Transcript_6335/g.11259 Transcript_6335/m.11259 type:complete len:631 (+) Transcript_6335:31-1923(+)
MCVEGYSPEGVEEVIQKYEFAINSSGLVYQARNLAKNEVHETCMVPRSKLAEWQLELILQELHRWQTVEHRNIVQLLDVVNLDIGIIIVMAEVGGTLLSDVISQNGMLGEAQSHRYFKSIVTALSYCAIMGVYHRNLHPDCILIDTSGVLKVGGFGFYHLHPITSYLAPELELSTGEMSPAMALAADVWSLGMILYEMLAGWLPNLSAGTIPFPNHFPVLARDLSLHMLVPHPEERYTIDVIITHPWFQEEPSGSNLRDNGTPLGLISEPLQTSQAPCTVTPNGVHRGLACQSMFAHQVVPPLDLSMASDMAPKSSSTCSLCASPQARASSRPRGSTCTRHSAVGKLTKSGRSPRSCSMQGRSMSPRTMKVSSKQAPGVPKDTEQARLRTVLVRPLSQRTKSPPLVVATSKHECGSSIKNPQPMAHSNLTSRCPARQTIPAARGHARRSSGLRRSDETNATGFGVTPGAGASHRPMVKATAGLQRVRQRPGGSQSPLPAWSPECPDPVDTVRVSKGTEDMFAARPDRRQFILQSAYDHYHHFAGPHYPYNNAPRRRNNSAPCKSMRRLASGEAGKADAACMTASVLPESIEPGPHVVVSPAEQLPTSMDYVSGVSWKQEASKFCYEPRVL